MNILYVGAFRLPHYDAAAARVLTIGRALAASGNQIEYLSWGGKYDNDDYIPNKGYIRFGMKYTITGELNDSSIATKIKNKLFRGDKTLELIRQKQPDVIITYNTPYRFNKKLINLTRDWGIKLVADITEWYDDSELHFFDRKKNDRNMREIYPLFPNKIVISSFLDKFYSTTHNIVIPALCCKDDEKWNIEKEVSTGDIRLIYAGNPAKKDDIHTVINVVNNLCKQGYKLQFRIVGITKDDYLRKYHNRLKCNELSKSIIFEGRVSQNDVPKYYGQSDFMILIRQDNRKSKAGFPTKFAESMMSGTPVISNATSDIPVYLIHDMNGVLVNSSRYIDIEESLLHILNDFNAKKISEMKEEAKKTGDTRFDYHAYIKSLSFFITNLL